MVVILISGYATSGKDTFSDYVIKYLPCAKKFPIAYDLKEIASKYFGWDGNKDEKGRNLLIGIGSVGRAYNPYIWVDKAIKRIKSESPPVAIVSDWRFKNEFIKVVEAFGRDSVITVRIKRNVGRILDDISEHDLDDFMDYDYIVDNNGTLEDLEGAARDFIGRLLLM